MNLLNEMERAKTRTAGHYKESVYPTSFANAYMTEAIPQIQVTENLSPL